jgi:hypothetical protein
MEDRNASPERRKVLQMAAALAASSSLGGCQLLVRKPTPVCPDAPEVSGAGHLTIDAHCHVFNGSDLPINGFVTHILGRQSGALGVGARAIAPLLQSLGWEVAPTGAAEIKQLAALGRELESCSPKQHQERLQQLRDAAYKGGRTTLKTALASSPELQQLKQQAQVQGRALDGDPVIAARLQLIAEIEGLPEEERKYKEKRADSGISLLAHQRSARGMLDFILQNFQYRYVSVYDYLFTYDKPKNQRVIDLMLPSMVDYDFWLAKGDATPTNLASQVDVMEGIAIATGGRVHAFVPFDPLRDVAFKLNHSSTDSFTLVTQAIEKRGCVGVKLYPPMGFAAYGNKHQREGFWKQEWLPKWVQETPKLGELLDSAMLNMLSWCEKNEVPVMAHTGLSNGPSDAFQNLAGSQYWSQALDQVKGLRVSFGHFGDSDFGGPDAPGSTRARGFMALMGTGAQAKGRKAYADAGYFVEGLSQQPQLRAALRELYEASTPGIAPLSTRFMYGTDWEMTLAEGKVIDDYLDSFIAVFDELSQRPAILSQGVANLADRFFGLNAVEWVGLRAGERARERLDAFYKEHKVDKPAWARKLDA